MGEKPSFRIEASALEDAVCELAESIDDAAIASSQKSDQILRFIRLYLDYVLTIQENYTWFMGTQDQEPPQLSVAKILDLLRPNDSLYTEEFSTEDADGVYRLEWVDFNANTSSYWLEYSILFSTSHPDKAQYKLCFEMRPLPSEIDTHAPFLFWNIGTYYLTVGDRDYMVRVSVTKLEKTVDET